MPKINISRQTPPILGDGVYWKNITYISDMDFTLQLANWIANFVMPQRAMHLVMTADGYNDIIDYIHRAPVDMALPGPRDGRTWRVDVDFMWGKTYDGQWWVRGIGLSIHDSVENISEVKRQEEIERIRDRYEQRALLAGPPPRVLWFPIEKYSQDHDQDGIHGKHIMQMLVEKVVDAVVPLARMPTNPIGPNPDDPWSILAATLTAGASAATGQIITALKDIEPEVGEALDNASIAMTGVAGLEKQLREFAPLEGVVDLIEIGLEVLDLAGPFGPMVGILVGSFIDIAIANQAGPVSRVRSQYYAFYVGGLVHELAKSTRVRPRRKGEWLMYQFGEKQARRLGGPQRYQLQLALMTYAFGRPIGEWSLHPMFSFAGSDKPIFPDDYIRYWSPDILERALMIKLCQPDFLYRNPGASE